MYILMHHTPLAPQETPWCGTFSSMEDALACAKQIAHWKEGMFSNAGRYDGQDEVLICWLGQWVFTIICPNMDEFGWTKISIQ